MSENEAFWTTVPCKLAFWTLRWVRSFNHSSIPSGVEVSAAIVVDESPGFDSAA